jgi:hypothetical protein
MSRRERRNVIGTDMRIKTQLKKWMEWVAVSRDE